MVATTDVITIGASTIDVTATDVTRIATGGATIGATTIRGSIAIAAVRAVAMAPRGHCAGAVGLMMWSKCAFRGGGSSALRAVESSCVT